MAEFYRTQEVLNIIADTGTASVDKLICITVVSHQGRIFRYLLPISVFVDQKSSLQLDMSASLVSFIRDLILTQRTSAAFQVEEELYVIDVIQKHRTIIILGAGHVGKSLAVLGAFSGFHIILIDDRESFLQKVTDIHPFIQCKHQKFVSLFEDITPDKNCAIVIVTRGHHYDSLCLQQALSTEAYYIGMIGSKRRVLSIVNQLKQSELTLREIRKLDGLYAPIGLEIGARLPEEIAISILAQIIKVMNSVAESTDK